MSSNQPKIKLIILASIAAIVFCAGLVQLFFLRFEAGDVYPPYSSMRSDPLGTQVLYESLKQVAQASTFRNFRALDHVGMTPQTTLMVCGVNERDLFLQSKAFANFMNKMETSGGRLILTFTTHVQKKEDPEEEDQKDPNGPESEDPSENKGSEEGRSSPHEDKSPVGDENDEWHGAASLGFDFRHSSLPQIDDMTASLFSSEADDLPSAIAWRTNLTFDILHQAWQTVYTWRGNPVIVQRSWGRGQVVMVADSYLLSNEAMRHHRVTDLIVWLSGSNQTVVFDEFHHGLAHRPGIAGLARQYRLHGVFGAILIVAILFIWQQSTVFVPSDQTSKNTGDPSPAAGRDTTEGLVDLTRQHIDTGRLLSTCLEVWEPLCAQHVPPAAVAEIRALVQQAASDPKQHKPVDVYRQICERLKQGNRNK